MMKVAVEVVGAHDLPPKSSRGTASPLVQVLFDGQRRRTRTRPDDLSPTWNETLLFDISDAASGHLDLPARAIDVSVYHRRPSGRRSCLGRVRLFGSAVAPSRAEAALLRCPLDKPSLFAQARGEVALRLFVIPCSSSTAAAPPRSNIFSSTYPPTFQDNASAAGPQTIVGGASTQSAPATNKKKPSRASHSVASQSSTQPHPPPHQPRAAMLAEDLQPSPPTAASQGGKNTVAKAKAKAASYLLVEQVEFLYVNIVRAKDLPGMDLTGSLDPYVVVRVGNYAGETRHLEGNQHPGWHRVFAFRWEHLQADRLEVILMDKNLVVQDNFVGKVVLNINEVPERAPPGSPVAPQWYRLRDNRDEITRGELMMSAWKGTQADEAFADAWHTDAHIGVPSGGIPATRAKTYFSPRLCYLRVRVIAAQDLIHPDRDRAYHPDLFVTVQLGEQVRHTRRSLSPMWDQEFLLVAAWPFDEPLVVSVNDIVAPGQHVLLGTLVLPKGTIKTQLTDKKKFKPIGPVWFDLGRPNGNRGSTSDGGGNSRHHAFQSKIQLQLHYDAAYHVLDEWTNYSSDFQPSAKPLRSQSIGVLELGILSARGLRPMQSSNGRRATTDAYCVAKYGPKWVRTRTLLDNMAPSWHEQYAFDVFDPCTVLTVAVFDNCLVNGIVNGNLHGLTDRPLGKVRIRVSTLDSGRTYAQNFSLFVIDPSGLKKGGELRLAVRFTCTNWLGMMRLYVRPTLPKEHFAKPIPTTCLPFLWYHAVRAITARFSRAEPPLLPEVVYYMLRHPNAHPVVPGMRNSYSVRQSTATCNRIRAVLSGIDSGNKWLDGVRSWDNPIATVLVSAVFLVLTWRPGIILPTFFLWLFAIGVWNYWWRPQRLPQLEHHADAVHQDALDEEFDMGSMASPPPDVVLRRYNQLRGAATRVQNLIGDAAGQGERVGALLSWRDRRATVIAMAAAMAMAVVFYAGVPLKAVVAVYGLYELRHPLFRRKVPSPAWNFFRRLPTNADVMF